MRYRIKELRKARGWRQQDLSEKARLSRSYIQELESGTKVLNDRNLTKIARALGVDELELIDFGELDSDVSCLIQMFYSLPESRREHWLRMAVAAGEALQLREGDTENQHAPLDQDE